ncbi:MAG: efflux RND transporter periplasmic adaptor subunit [Isosphaeraceae bacterium]
MNPDGLSGQNSAPEVPPTRWQKFRMVVKVIELRLRFIALMAATALVFGYWDTIWNSYEKWSRPPREAVSATSHDEFYCPMHPSVVRDTMGSCPICGMPLSKRKKGQAEALPPGVVSRLTLTPLRVVQAGIRTSEVTYEPLAETLTTVGTVAFDERRLARIASKTKGVARVEKLVVNFTGTDVVAGQPLAELYSPELYQAVQELLQAQRRVSDPSAPRGEVARSLLGDARELVRLGREKLALWGLTPGQIDGILASGRAGASLPILSPISGTVVRKNVVEGQYVNEGDALFEVADLSRVWVLAHVYEDQIGLVRVGQAVEATVGAYPGEVFKGEVAFLDPTLDPATRTLNVRYDLANPDRRLLPGMFATVTLRTPIAETPAFKDRVASAPRSAATVTPASQKICPVTQLKLGAMGEPVPTEVQGQKVWMCCPACETKLRASPASFLARLAPVPQGAVLSVPEAAVIDTGTRKVVYVETDPGVFEGRAVVLGPRAGDRYPVLDGLSPGDKVAAAGAFLIDAETRLNPTAPTTPEPKPEPASEPKSPPEPTASPRTAALSEGSAHRH